MALSIHMRPHAAALAAILLAAGGSTAQAATHVTVVLQDQSTAATVPMMQIVSTASEAKTGRIVFSVKNESKSLVHEMLLVKAVPPAALRYDDKENKLVEDKFVKFIDTDDIKPGGSVTKVVTLAPGVYEMLCNQPGHFRNGMHVAFSVHR